jgi:DNA-binding beta-propeller fold protein YncE
LIGISAMIALMSLVQAQEVPDGTSIPVSSRDRVYTADQLSNTVSVIEGFLTPNGKELWVAVRGEHYLAVIDPAGLKEVRCIRVANGPGIVPFRPDGRYAFVPSSFTPELAVIDVRSYKVIAKVQQASPFSPNLAVSPDGEVGMSRAPVLEVPI